MGGSHACWLTQKGLCDPGEGHFAVLPPTPITASLTSGLCSPLEGATSGSHHAVPVGCSMWAAAICPCVGGAKEQLVVEDTL